MKSPWVKLLILLFIFGTLFTFLMSVSALSLFGETSIRVTSKNSILHLELEGIIMDGKKFLKNLIKYRKDNNIKAIVVSINSPGGVVGPSQEIHAELLRVREEFKKPVVVHSAGLMASGGYYAAVAADKIVVAPGTLLGSIGVIMQFTNLEKLYDWAKIKRYSITTGKFKDSGAEYRPMRDDERSLFQQLMFDVLAQFKEAVAEGRQLKTEEINKYSDGRIFTGKQAKELNLVDEIGTLEDAYALAADLAGIRDYEVFNPPKLRSNFFEIFREDDDYGSKVEKVVDEVSQKLFHTKLVNQPLFLMPGVLE